MSTVEATITPASKLPFSRTLLGAYATVFKNLWPFAQIATFPLALGVLLPYLWAEIYGPLFDRLVKIIGYQPAVALNSLNPQGIVEQVVAWFVLVLFMSHWLQYLAARNIGKKQPGGRPRIVRFFSRRDPRVLRYGLLLLIPTVSIVLIDMLAMLLNRGYVDAEPLHVLVAAIDSSPILFALAVMLADAVVAGRSAPIFAAAAAGEPMALRRAWQMTRGQTLRLLLLWMVLFTLTYTLGLPLQTVVKDIYITLISMFHEPGQYISLYYQPPFTLLIALPTATVHCAAMALGACVFWRVYRGEAEARDDLLERFD